MRNFVLLKKARTNTKKKSINNLVETKKQLVATITTNEDKKTNVDTKLKNKHKNKKRKQNIGKEMLIEGFRYYTIALQWLRIIQMKRSNSQQLTANEEAIMGICDTTNFTIKHPIYVYLQLQSYAQQRVKL